MTESSGTENDANTDTPDAVDQETGGGNQKVDGGRRNFTRAGLAAPVLLSVVNRTAWAGPACTISAFASTTFASTHPELSQLCGMAVGCSPGYWRNRPEAWPIDCVPDSEIPIDPCTEEVPTVSASGYTCYSSGNKVYQRDGTLFSAAFGCSVDGANEDGVPWTLMEVLQNGQGNGTNTGNIEFHAVAALLNRKTNQPNFNLSLIDVKAIFCGLILSGTYPMGPEVVGWDDMPNSAGVTWTMFFTDYNCVDNTKNQKCSNGGNGG